MDCTFPKIKHMCECNKTYASNASLIRHQKRCTIQQEFVHANYLQRFFETVREFESLLDMAEARNPAYNMNFYVSDVDSIGQVVRDIYDMSQSGDFLTNVKNYAAGSTQFVLDIQPV